MARNYNPKYKINLVTVFDRAYAGDSNDLRSALRPVLKDPFFRTAFSRRIIDRIVDRTLSGRDRKGNIFPSYSEEYKKSLQYRAFGKSAAVNLRLSGSMLSDINSADAFNTITFNFGSQENRNKARGHITGGEGKWNKNGPLKKRDFFGLPEAVENKILRETLADVRTASRAIQADLFEFLLVPA